MADTPSSPLSPAVNVPKVAPAPAPVRPVVPVMVAQPPSPTTPTSPQTPAPPSTPPPSTIAVPPPPPPAPGAPAKPTVVVVTKPAPSPSIAKPPSIPVPKPSNVPATSPLYRPAVAVPMPKLSNPIPQFPPHMVPQPFVPGMAQGMQGPMPGMPGFMDLDPNVFDPSSYPDPNYPPDEPTPPPAPIIEAAAPPTDAGLRQFTEHLAHLDVLLSTGIVENTHYEYQKARLVDRFVLADPNPTVEWRFANHLAYLDGLLAAGALNTMDHSFYKSQLVDSYVLCVGEWIHPQLPVITHRPLPLSAPCYGLVVMGAPMCQPLNPSLGALVLRPKVNRSYCYGPRDIFGKALPNVVLNAEDLRRLLCFKLTWDCIICSKVFSQEYPQLAQHYRARHPGTPQTQAILKKFWNKNLVCQFCSKTFTCMQGIMAHKRTVHLDQPQAQEELKAYDAQEEAEKVARWTKKTQLDMDKINAAYETLRELDGQYAALCRHAASTDQATMQLAAREMFIVVEAALKAMCVINVAARGGTAAPVVEGGAQEIRGGLLCQCMRYLGDNHLMPPKMGIRLDAARKLRNEVFHTLGVKITSQDLEEQRQLLEDVLTWGFAMLKTAAQVMGGDVGAGSGIGEFKAIQASAGVGTLEPPPAPNVPTPHEPKDMAMIVTNIKRSRSPDEDDRKRRRTSPRNSPPPRARGRGRGGYNGIGAGRWGRGQDGAEIIKLLDGVEKERGDDRDDRSRDRRRSRSRGRDRRR